MEDNKVGHSQVIWIPILCFLQRPKESLSHRKRLFQRVREALAYLRKIVFNNKNQSISSYSGTLLDT